MQDPILKAVTAHYEQALATHGPTAKGVDWKDEEGQRLRHRQFLRLVEGDPEASILDLGCGYGDFLPFLRAHGHRGRYIGLDVAPAMVEEARRLHGEGPDRAFFLGAESPEAADYAIASGILNVIRGADPAAWPGYVDGVIEGLARSSRRGFAFNMLSLNSDPERRRADLHYADPAAMLAAMIARHGRHAAVLQDYGLWEFTLIQRHAPGSHG
ncbi:methyltransferase [Roseomonas sp. F4]